MMLQITGLYAGLLTIIFIVLVVGVGRERQRAQVTLLDGGDMALATAIRRHGNFIEYVPLALILMAVLELSSTSSTLIHVLGIILVISRIAHPLGTFHDRPHPLRAIGATGSLLVLSIAGGIVLYQSIMWLFV